MESQVNPQPDDAHIRISHEIHRELIRRNFTKRQRDIIDFILTLSWGCGKPSAVIPQLRHFELCGVGRNKIRDELEKLVESKVIYWHQATNIFQFNKHFDQWGIPEHGSNDKDLMKELIDLNWSERTPNLEKTVPEKGIGFPKRESKSVPKKGTQFPKGESESSQKGNSPVPKKGIVTFVKSSRIKGFKRSKELNKEFFKELKKKDLKSISSLAHRKPKAEREEKSRRSKPDFTFGSLYQIFSKHFITDQRKLEIQSEIFTDLFDTYGGERLYAAFREAAKYERYNIPYVESILRGKPKPAEPERARGNAPPAAGGQAVPSVDETLSFIEHKKAMIRKQQEELERKRRAEEQHGQRTADRLTL